MRLIITRIVRFARFNEIARNLLPVCSPRSVETHRANLFAKLALGNDNELGRWLLQNAWLG